jgi:oligopeptide transport system permease protein
MSVASPPNSKSAHKPKDLDRYRQMLMEAASLKGTSLWQDAWKRLKRNRPAIVSLVFLIVVAMLAVVTPFLPFQSPSYQILDEQFAEPSLKAIRLELRQPDNSVMSPTETWRQYLDERSKQTDSRTPPTTINPIIRLWGQLDIVSHTLTRMRLGIFGDWCFPSICGRDALGRDLLSRIFWGARVSILVGLAATFVSLVIGVTYGAISGYAGGWVDQAMMRIVDILYAVPFLFIVIVAMAIVTEPQVARWLEERHIGVLGVFLILLGLVSWLTMARVVRGQILSLKTEQYVDAARVIGAGSPRIIFRHLIPNVLGIVIVYLTLTIPSVMLFEATLSFLGLGVRPPNVSWGLLLKDAAEVINPIRTRWWLVVFPGVALSSTMFALNYLGDGLRDVLDPHLKNKS